MTATIKALSDGLSGELQVGGSPALRFGADTSGQLSGFRNKIINGDMRIDQRNAGASVAWSSANLFPVDRWKAFAATGSGHTAQRIADAPSGSGFVYSTKLTVGTGGAPAAADLNIFYQAIEGLNVSDLAFGTSGAKTVTIGFWVKSSITGNFGVGLQNGAVNRGYPGQYTINAANTWEYKTVTIPGDTAGTWASDNSVGVYASFDLGSGANSEGALNTWGAGNYKRVSGQTKLIQTNGATWQVTGVQLEVGSVATPFERRPYQVELALCQRYYEKSYNQSVVPGSVSDLGAFFTVRISNVGGGGTGYKVSKRATPTVTLYSPVSGASGQARDYTTSADTAASAQSIGENGFYVLAGSSASGNGLGVQWTASAEL